MQHAIMSWHGMSCTDCS